MKLGLCIEIMFRDLPFAERIAKAAELGFRDLEMWFVDGTYKGSPEDLAKLAADHGVRIATTVIGSPDGKRGGGLVDPTCRESWLERTRMTLAFNAAAGIGATIVCTGNVEEGMTNEQMSASVIEGLQATAELAEQAGVTLLLEALNTTYDHAGYFLSSSDVGAELCRQVGSPRMRLLYDCYHMQIMEGDLLEHIRRNIDVIGHFHAAGVPGRHELDRGEINYPYLIEQIGSLGFDGIFALEYKPSIGDEESLRGTLEYLKEVCPPKE